MKRLLFILALLFSAPSYAATLIDLETQVKGVLPRDNGGNGSATSLSVLGATSGTISILGQTNAGTYNFNLPITSGTSGQVLTSAGGGSSPMTWSTVTPFSGSLTNGGLIWTDGTNFLSTGALSGIIQGNGAAAPTAVSNVTRTVASGAKALATSAIASATCTTAQTDTATGTLTTDALIVSFNGDPTAVTGYVPLTTGMLAIIAYPTADTVNFKVCNNTASSITPGAITLNWRVTR